jgi:hypothetical protein
MAKVPVQISMMSPLGAASIASWIASWVAPTKLGAPQLVLGAPLAEPLTATVHVFAGAAWVSDEGAATAIPRMREAAMRARS